MFKYKININSVTVAQNLIAEKKKRLKIVKQNGLFFISTVEVFNEYLIILKKTKTTCNLNHWMEIAFQMHSTNAHVQKGKALHFYKVKFCTAVGMFNMTVVLWS